jgi:hypothetical protein
MGLLTILKKVKEKEKEVRLLILWVAARPSQPSHAFSSSSAANFEWYILWCVCVFACQPTTALRHSIALLLPTLLVASRSSHSPRGEILARVVE